MYSVFADGVCIFDDASPNSELALYDPVLEMEAGAAGSFTFTVLPSNVGYSSINRLVTKIVINKDGEIFWAGRPITEEVDFIGRRKVVCEGELAYLNDTTQPQAEYHDITVIQFIGQLLDTHNAKVSADKQFVRGMVTVSDNNDSLYRYTNYETNMECFTDKLTDRLGGRLMVRYEDGARYLDCLKEPVNTNSQTITFGENLLDFVKSYDASEFCTVVLPLGAALDESPIEALTAYLDVSSVNGGSKYVASDDAVAAYGRIEKVVHFDDVTVASNLLTKARRYLNETQFENMTLEVRALDLHYLNVSVESIKLFDNVRVVSAPHGLDRLFPVMKLTIPLADPENAVFELGTTVKQTLTGYSRKTNSDILDRIASMPSSMLEAARDNASQLIQNATGGYVTIRSDGSKTQEIIISDTNDYTTAQRIWRWNVNGLGYSSNGYSGSYNLAMTMDGAIVADRITTGTLSADRIRGGQLVLGGIDNANGVYVLKDGTGRAAVVMTNDGMTSLASNRYYMRLSPDGALTGGIYSGSLGNDYLSAMSDSTNYTQYGRLDSAGAVTNIDTGDVYHGFCLRSEVFEIRADHLAVLDSQSSSATSTLTVQNEQIPYVKAIRDNGDGTISWDSGYLEVINGMITAF